MILSEKYPNTNIEHYLAMYSVDLDMTLRKSLGAHAYRAGHFEGNPYLVKLLEELEFFQENDELGLLIEYAKEDGIHFSKADFQIMKEEIEDALQNTKMKDVIEQFYTAFTNLDGDGMAACYHNDIVFEDPAFGVLKGEKAKNMWRMLCESQKGQDFVVEYATMDVDAFKDKGSAHWEAHYTFSKTNRKVHNIIDAEFEFKDGKIIRHTDHFNLYNWSKQALGLQGWLLGWTPFFKKKLNEQTNGMLKKFEEKIV